MVTPPEEVPPTRRGWMGRSPGDGEALVPMPGNAEFVVIAVVGLLVAIISLFVDDVNGGDVVTALVVLTSAYVLSRGIAKASRVFER